MTTLHHCYTDRHKTYYLRVKLPRDIASDHTQPEIRSRSVQNVGALLRNAQRSRSVASSKLLSALG